MKISRSLIYPSLFFFTISQYPNTEYRCHLKSTIRFEVITILIRIPRHWQENIDKNNKELSRFILWKKKPKQPNLGKLNSFFSRKTDGKRTWRGGNWAEGAACSRSFVDEWRRSVQLLISCSFAIVALNWERESQFQREKERRRGFTGISFPKALT